jgi:hypothetical protein
MGGKAPKVPKVVERDPVAEQRAAEAEATAKTNAELAMRNRRRRGSLLQTSSAGYGPAPNTLLAQATGKPVTLGSGGA